MSRLRKIVVLVMLLIFCAMTLGGCGNKVDGSSESVIKNPTNSPIEKAIDTPTHSSTEPSEDIINQDNMNKDENDLLKQLAIVYKENVIAISDIVDDQKIESMLGKADEIKSHTYSIDDGLNMDQLNGMTEKQYRYPGLVLKTIDGAVDQEFFIFSMEVTDSKYPTLRNIKVGDSFEKLKEAYPEGVLLGGELSDAEDDFRYEPIDYVNVMNFHIKDKKVESILIYKLLD